MGYNEILMTRLWCYAQIIKFLYQLGHEIHEYNHVDYLMQWNTLQIY